MTPIHLGSSDSVESRVAFCPVCHSQMLLGQQFCRNCGASMCPHCQTPLPQRSRYCPKCGFLCVREQRGVTSKFKFKQPTRPGQAKTADTHRAPSAPEQPQTFDINRAPSAPQPTAQATPQPQTMDIPRVPSAPQRQTPIPPIIQEERNCPKCGAKIDLELGRCPSCGLLYGIKRQVPEQAIRHAPTPPPPAPRPRIPTEQQTPAAYDTMPRYNYPTPSPPSFGQRPSYGTPGAMPPDGVLMPIPRAVPAAASAGPQSASPAMPAEPFPYQPVPPSPRERRMPSRERRGGPGIAAIVVPLIICLIIGIGIYYAMNRTQTPSPPSITEDWTPPDIQTVETSAITETDALIEWETDEPATSQVAYGTTEDYDSETTLDEELTTSHAVKLVGLEPGTTYHFQVISIDAAGNPAKSEGELTTAAEADETPPTISAVNASNITKTGATITWKTDEKSTSQVEYGKTEDYGSKTPPAEELTGQALTTSHSVKLTGLANNTTYNFRVISKDASGNTETSTNQTFKTITAIAVGPEEGKLAPDFTLEDLSGNDITLNDLQGKIVLVNFWSTTCEACVDELPFIQAVYDDRSGAGLVVLAINTADTKNTVRGWMTEQANQGEEYTFTVLIGYNEDVTERYDITMIPTTFFIDADGIIGEITVGSFDSADEIEDILDSL